MSNPAAAEVVRQHLIDPEICIRCNTCEESCPIDAITHDARNYVVDPGKCENCNECIAPCPTGAIDSWRHVATIELPPSLAAVDYSGISVRDERIAVLSQCSGVLWTGYLS